MKKAPSDKPVERMFPFVLRARALIVGRDTLRRSKGRLHFVLITHDLSDSSREEVLSEFSHYPIVQHYTTEDLEKFFGIKGAKVVGFQKSGLAQSIYAELKEHRVNKPPQSEAPTPLSDTGNPDLTQRRGGRRSTQRKSFGQKEASDQGGVTEGNKGNKGNKD